MSTMNLQYSEAVINNTNVTNTPLRNASRRESLRKSVMVGYVNSPNETN